MIKIHATKKLLTKLPVNEQGFLPSGKNAPPQQGNTTEQPESLISVWPIKAMGDLLGSSIEPMETLKSEPNMESSGGAEIIQLSRIRT